MNREVNVDQVLDSWFTEGPTNLPDRTVAAIVEGLDDVHQRGPVGLPWRLRMFRFVPALAGAAIVLLVGVVALGVYLNRPGIGVEPSPTPSASPAQVLAPTAEPVMPSGQPTSSPEPTTQLSEPPHTHETIAAGPGFVAVGAYDALDDQADIWTSADGRTWTRVPSEQLGPGVVNDVTTGGPGLVAVGAGVTDGYHAAVWTSEDGLTWSRLTDGPDFNVASMSGVTAGGPGVVAVGDFARAWFSSDGLIWNLATAPPDTPSGLGPQHPHIFMGDVAAADGRFVAVGDNWQTERPVIWTSADGMAWTNVLLNPEVFPDGSLLGEVTGGPDGFTITGLDGAGRTVTWVSRDGRLWLPSSASASPVSPTIRPEVVHGWPDTSENAPGLYSWTGSGGDGSHIEGFMHNGYGSGDVTIHMEVAPEEPIPAETTPVTVGGYEATHRRIDLREDDWAVDLGWPIYTDDARAEEWIVEIDGTAFVIHLIAREDTSQAELDEAHAIIDSIRIEQYPTFGFRVVFRLITDDWDSG